MSVSAVLLATKFSINYAKIQILNMDGAAALMFSTLLIVNVLKIENAVTEPMVTVS